ncbi:flagellar biosynthetic protein FliR [Sphaerotilus microaerophilus]|uniref:Flagellar biosynthetic protein FliR n=1 Tax=Sphaerotilus microaerophilus TaxID=2914710 RepID=A0ABM7YJ66_9BURK|nr:flagellar biosynthetic protein FliR [Sphaerotilus sp. FB-5]BDI04467.1 flagellar biosynthetic protein FliR [Sphaerotilus sp. FB-5]
MLTFNEVQILQWLTPLLWPFLRTLALFTSAPVLSSRAVPMRIKIGLALLIAVAAQASLPEMPVVPLDSATGLAMVVQQVLIGLTLGFSARVVFAAVEFAGELVGLQMGLNFAGFFDPATGSQGTATSRFFTAIGSLLFVVVNGHLLLSVAVLRSFEVFPVAAEPLAFIATLQPQVWGAEVFRLGLWIALPIVTMLLFVNLVLGVISRVAQQIQIFSVGFSITVSVGLIGTLLTLPMLQAPLVAALERMLALFQ